MYYSISATCELVGVDRDAVEAWIGTGVVTLIPSATTAPGWLAAALRMFPPKPQFTEMQVLGLMVGWQTCLREPTCSKDYFQTIVRAFSLVTPEWLQTRFRSEESYLAAVVNGYPVLRRKDYDWINVQKCYQDLQHYEKLHTGVSQFWPRLHYALGALGMLGLGGGGVAIVDGLVTADQVWFSGGVWLAVSSICLLVALRCFTPRLYN